MNQPTVFSLKQGRLIYKIGTFQRQIWPNIFLFFKHFLQFSYFYYQLLQIIHTKVRYIKSNLHPKHHPKYHFEYLFWGLTWEAFFQRQWCINRNFRLFKHDLIQIVLAFLAHCLLHNSIFILLNDRYFDKRIALHSPYWFENRIS